MAIKLLEDGAFTTISFALNPTVKLYETEVGLAGFSTGGPNDITHMRRKKRRGKASKKLITPTDPMITVMYDPDVLDPDVMQAMAGKNQLITWTLPDGGEVEDWGFIDEWQPAPFKPDTVPTAQLKLVMTATDNDGEEVEGPTYTPAP